jgi:signal transduction histidine kinase
MFRLGRDGTYLEFAGDLTRLATPPEELLGSRVQDILPPEVAHALMAGVERALATRELQTVAYRLRTLAGEVCDFEGRIVRANDDEVVTVVRDVTERLRAEEAVRESRARVFAAEEAERRRLSRNIHDGAQQSLVAVNLHLQRAELELDRDPGAARGALGAAREALTAGIDDIRQLAQGLHPPLLAQDGLADAVRALAERSTVPVELEALPETRLPEVAEVVAYYVIAESLSNAAKHARASRVTVAATLADDELVVEVTDDGVGGAHLGGSGLRGLADRVAAVGGSFEVTRAAGGGTRVRATMPAARR